MSMAGKITAPQDDKEKEEMLEKEGRDPPDSPPCSTCRTRP